MVNETVRLKPEIDQLKPKISDQKYVTFNLQPGLAFFN